MYVWEARQSGRPADKYMVRCLEAGPSRRPKMYIAGKPDKTEYTMILRLHHTWRMSNGWKPCGQGGHEMNLVQSRHADRPTTNHRKAENQRHA